MRLDEGAEPGLPQDVGQAGVAVKLMIALDQAPALWGQVPGQEAEVGAFSLAGESCSIRIARREFHRIAPR